MVRQMHLSYQLESMGSNPICRIPWGLLNSAPWSGRPDTMKRLGATSFSEGPVVAVQWLP